MHAPEFHVEREKSWTIHFAIGHERVMKKRIIPIRETMNEFKMIWKLCWHWWTVAEAVKDDEEIERKQTSDECKLGRRHRGVDDGFVVTFLPILLTHIVFSVM